MQNLIDVYEKLSNEYKVEWINDKDEGFYLYVTRGKKEYRIMVCVDLVQVEIKRKIFRHEYWKSQTHFHFDNNEDNFEKMYNQILDYINNVMNKKYSFGKSVDKILDTIKFSFQKATLSTILLTISLVIFALFAQQIIFDSFLMRLKYYALTFIPVAVFLLLTFLTYKGKIKEGWSSLIALVLFLIFNVYNLIMIFAIAIDEIENPISNIRYYEQFRHEDFPEEIPKEAKDVKMYYQPGLLQGGSVTGVYFRIDNEEIIQEYISKYEKEAKYSSLNYEPDGVTGYLSSDFLYTPYEYQELPKEFVIYYLEQRCDDSGYCNHGEYTIVAINDDTNEVICENSVW